MTPRINYMVLALRAIKSNDLSFWLHTYTGLLLSARHVYRGIEYFGDLRWPHEIREALYYAETRMYIASKEMTGNGETQTEQSAS